MPFVPRPVHMSEGTVWKPWLVTDQRSYADRPDVLTYVTAPLTAPRETLLLTKLAEYPEILQKALEELGPHQVAFYLRDLAGELHSYYNAERVLVDDVPTRMARLALLLATRQVLKNGLSLLGVSAPARM